MVAPNTTTTLVVEFTFIAVALSSEELATKAVHKRYEDLVTVRTKVVKGKGASYWAYFEPNLVHHTNTGFAKAVKLRCSFCNAIFSASNLSRIDTEHLKHLKRGTCPNFASAPKPISFVPSSSSVSMASMGPSTNTSSPHWPHSHHRKRCSFSGSRGEDGGGVGGGSSVGIITTLSQQHSKLMLKTP